MLGTIHHGVSLEDLRCSKQIQAQALKSDTVFVENQLAEINNRAGLALAFLTGSEEENEKILSGLSSKMRDFFKEHLSLRRKAFSRSFYENDEGDFKSLSQAARDILISEGADRQWNYFDYFFYLKTKAELEFDIRQLSKGSLDVEIAALAKAGGIELKPLEEIGDGLRSVEKIIEKLLPNEGRIIISRGILEEFIAARANRENLEKTKGAFVKSLYETYKSGDSQKLTGLLDLSDPTDAVFSQILLEERNRLWLEKLKAEMESGKTVFAAAGVGHFIKDDHLLGMLKEEGFLIRRMRRDCSMSAR